MRAAASLARTCDSMRPAISRSARSPAGWPCWSLTCCRSVHVDDQAGDAAAVALAARDLLAQPRLQVARGIPARERIGEAAAQQPRAIDEPVHARRQHGRDVREQVLAGERELRRRAAAAEAVGADELPAPPEWQHEQVRQPERRWKHAARGPRPGRRRSTARAARRAAARGPRGCPRKSRARQAPAADPSPAVR